MDSTLLGALIGVGGACVGAFSAILVAMLSARAQRKDALEQARHDAAVRLMSSLVQFMHAIDGRELQAQREAQATAYVDTQRVLMVADAKDVSGLERAGRFVLRNGDFATPVLAAGIEAFSEVLRRWARGDLHGDAIAVAYGGALDRLLGLADADVDSSPTKS